MEETGISVTQIRVIGKLTSLHIPVSHVEVDPYIAVCPFRPDFQHDPAEVQYLIEEKLSVLLDRRCIKSKTLDILENPVEIPYYDIKGNHIWGATAMILSEFLEIIRKAETGL
jgi:hypothetical protein